MSRPPAPSRRERTQANHARMLDAAHRLMVERGFVRTTMEAIAEQAGVSVQTVYFTFHNKAEVVRQVLKRSGARPEEPIEVLDRDWIAELDRAFSGERVMAMMAEHGTDMYIRSGPLGAIAAAAAATDESVAEAMREMGRNRKRDMRDHMQLLERRGWLRPGLDLDHATDVVFVFGGPAVFTEFRTGCGWSAEDFKVWLYNTFCDQLLAPHSNQHQARLEGVCALSFREAQRRYSAGSGIGSKVSARAEHG